MFAGPLGRSTFTPPKSSFDSPLYGLVSLRRSHQRGFGFVPIIFFEIADPQVAPDTSRGGFQAHYLLQNLARFVAAFFENELIGSKQQFLRRLLGGTRNALNAESKD